MEIVYEDEDVIVALKPAGVPSQKDKTGDRDMCGMLYEHTGGGYVGLIHRLDRPVGGLLVFAKNEFSCKKLSMETADSGFYKNYLAVVCGKAQDGGLLQHFLLKNQRLNWSKVVQKNTKGAKEAVLTYKKQGETLHETEGVLSLLEVSLQTGRHHQIRVQLSQEGLPIWGDTKYNEKFKKPQEFVNVALWAASLSFRHPKNGKQLSFRCYPFEDCFPFSCFPGFTIAKKQ